jgi:hypothetical protein
LVVDEASGVGDEDGDELCAWDVFDADVLEEELAWRTRKPGLDICGPVGSKAVAGYLNWSMYFALTVKYLSGILSVQA